MNERLKKTINELNKKYQSGILVIKDELNSLMNLPFDDPLRFEKATIIATEGKLRYI